MKIREVSGSTAAAPDSAYIMLQMYEAGQNQVSGHNITIWDQDALVLGMPVPIQSLPLTGPNPPNGQNQRTILIGDTGVVGRDFTLDLSPYFESGVSGNLLAAGAVCFEAIPVDCLSWGGDAFPNPNNLPDDATPHGNPLPTTFALRRDISRGCSTLLEAGDDTNNNQNDFAAVQEEPRSNGAAPREQSCGGAGVGGVPSLKCRGKEATLRGTAGKDRLKGTAERDVIVAGGGNDTVNGLGGNDLICGEDGKDQLKGGKGKDLLAGGAAADRLLGGPGKDRLLGGPGKDRLLGGPGKDVCSGGAAADRARKCEIKKKI